MPDTWTPVTLTNDTGQRLNATYFNRIETGIDTIDGRTVALELGVTTPITMTPSGGVLTPNATLGHGPHRHTATTDVTLAAPTGGVDGQSIEVQVYASGANRAVTAGGVTVTVTNGRTWWGHFSYNAGRDEWLLDDSGGGSVGTGTAAVTTYLRGDQSYADPTLQAAPVHAVGNSGASLTIDASSSSGWVKTITLTANCTVTLTGATSGRVTTLELYLTQDGTGSRAVTWPASVKWDGGAAPTLSTTAAAVDCIVLRTVNNGTTWLGNMAGKGYA